MNWYYIDESITSDDRRQGPFSKEDILELVERKIITDETLVWHTGLADWKLWKELKAEIEKESINI